MPFLFDDNHASPPFGQEGGNRSTSRSAADDKHIAVERHFARRNLVGLRQGDDTLPFAKREDDRYHILPPVAFWLFSHRRSRWPIVMSIWTLLKHVTPLPSTTPIPPLGYPSRAISLTGQPDTMTRLTRF